MKHKELIIGLVVGLFFGAGATGVFAQDDTNKRPEVLMSDGLAPTRAAPSGKAQITILAEGDKGFMGKMRIAAGAELPEHTDKSEEYLYVTKGKGKITIDGTEYKVSPNMGIFIPGGSKVSYKNGDRVMEAIQFFAGPESANKYSKWETGQEPLKDEPARGASSERSGSMR